jgi:hypothetical protein
LNNASKARKSKAILFQKNGYQPDILLVWFDVWFVSVPLNGATMLKLARELPFVSCVSSSAVTTSVLFPVVLL